MGRKRAVVLRFQKGRNPARETLDTLKSESGLLLLDEETVLDKSADNKQSVLFAGSATLIIRYFKKVTACRIAQTFEEIASLEPDYYGDRWSLTSPA
jgi:hypothetical protein